jgi:uncharacterized protein YbjT (DUF2867 family)
VLGAGDLVEEEVDPVHPAEPTVAVVDERWELRRGDEVIGWVDVDDGDFPWLSGAWVPGPAWDGTTVRFSDDDGSVLHDDEGRATAAHLLDVHRDGRAGFRWIEAGRAAAMHVAIVGGHGQVARLLTRLLVARGHRVRAIVRNPDHWADVEDDGADGVVCDLEASTDDLQDALAGVDAVVFAAGAGPGSGAARKLTVDRDGVTRTVAAAERAGVRRLVVVSAMGTDDPPDDDEVFSVYLRAKAEADRVALASSLDVTIVRPGGLTDDEGTGHITIGRHVAPGRIPRADVAAVVADVLAEPGSVGHIVEVVGGPTPIPVAVAEIPSLPGGKVG